MRRIALAFTLLVFVSHSPADDAKPTEADKAIADAVAALKAQHEKAKDDGERRKLAAAIAGLEATAKKAPKHDNHLLLDFVDNQAKYAKAKAKLTFLVQVGGNTSKDVGTIRDWQGASRTFVANAGDPPAKVTIEVHCPDAVLKAGPAARPGDTVLVTFTRSDDYGWEMLEIKRP